MNLKAADKDIVLAAANNISDYANESLSPKSSRWLMDMIDDESSDARCCAVGTVEVYGCCLMTKTYKNHTIPQYLRNHNINPCHSPAFYFFTNVRSDFLYGRENRITLGRQGVDMNSVVQSPVNLRSPFSKSIQTTRCLGVHCTSQLHSFPAPSPSVCPLFLQPMLLRSGNKKHSRQQEDESTAGTTRERKSKAANRTTTAAAAAPLPRLRYGRDRNVLLTSALQSPKAMKDSIYAADKAFVLSVVSKYGSGLEYAEDNLRADKDVVLAAVRNNGVALKFASNELRADHEIVTAAVHQRSDALEFASNELQSDRGFVMAAVVHGHANGSTLQFASDELRADTAVVMAAVHRHGFALQFASDELRADRAVVMAALVDAGCSSTLKFASDELRADQAVVMAAVNKNGTALQYASDELRAEQAVVMAAVNKDGMALEFASDELRSDQAVVMAAVNEDGEALEFASDELRSDQAVVVAAINQNIVALSYCSGDIFHCTTNESIQFVQTVLRTAHDCDAFRFQFLWLFVPCFQEVLINFRGELQGTGLNFSSDTRSAHIFAERWIAQLEEEHPTATRLLQLSHIIDFLKDVLSANTDSWWDFLSGLVKPRRRYRGPSRSYLP